MGRATTKFFAHLLLLASLWSIVAPESSSASVFDQQDTSVSEQITALATSVEHAEDSERDCDEETCQYHRCHLWHCAFISRETVKVRAPVMNDGESPFYTGSAATGVRSVLLEPPA